MRVVKQSPVRVLVWSAVVFASSLCIAAGQPAEEEEDETEKAPPLPADVAELIRRYSAVSEWRGFFEVSESGSAAWSGGYNTGSVNTATTSRGSFRIKRSDYGWEPERGMLQWGGSTTPVSGEASAQHVYQYSDWNKFGVGSEYRDEVGGTMRTNGAEFSFWLLQKSVTIRVGSAINSARVPFAKVGRSVSEQNYGAGLSRLVTTSLNRNESVSASFRPPLSTLFFKPADSYRVVSGGPGVLVFAASGESRADTQKSTPVIHHRSRVVLHPVYDDVALEVTIPQYEQWLPRGLIADPARPGSHITVRATLVRKGGAAAQPVAAKSFRFELRDASREPGICLNWPLLGADGDVPPEKDPKPDLRFAEDPGARLTQENLTAEVKPLRDAEGRESASVRVDSFDFGGTAELRVICVMADGREIVGTLKTADGAELAAISLPHRRTDSRIARAWQVRQDLVGADEEDLDPTPAGDGNRGDGFSNYEEYRGFVVNREHVRTKPGRKDFFVQNGIGQPALPGIFRFTDLTQLVTHYELRRDEMPASRRMNMNRSPDSPRTSTEHQHGVILQHIGGDVASMADIEGNFWRPKTTTIVVILSLLLKPEKSVELEATVAHELLHSISARHHGEVDDIEEWSRGERIVNGVKESWFQKRLLRWNDSGFVYADENAPQRIRIFTAAGQEIRAADNPERLATPASFWVGRHGGQHSGVVDCVMRYDCSKAYLRAGRPNDRFLSPHEPTGLGLCEQSAGTDFNAPGDRLRYADAVRGKCKTQFCVRDDAPDPGPRAAK